MPGRLGGLPLATDLSQRVALGQELVPLGRIPDHRFMRVPALRHRAVLLAELWGIGLTHRLAQFTFAAARM
jgi:hypothetical protein